MKEKFVKQQNVLATKSFISIKPRTHVRVTFIDSRLLALNAFPAFLLFPVLIGLIHPRNIIYHIRGSCLQKPK